MEPREKKLHRTPRKVEVFGVKEYRNSVARKVRGEPTGLPDD